MVAQAHRGLQRDRPIADVENKGHLGSFGPPGGAHSGAAGRIGADWVGTVHPLAFYHVDLRGRAGRNGKALRIKEI